MKTLCTILAAALIVGSGELAASEVSVAEQVEGAVVMIMANRFDPTNMLGTGFVVAPGNLIVTANHVVSRHRTLIVSRQVGTTVRWARVSVVKRIPERDIAILGSGAPADIQSLQVIKPLETGKPALLGAEVMIGGYPKVGTNKVLTIPFLRTGIVSSTRSATTNGTAIITLDIHSLPGYSGSPVVDMRSGTVVGVLRGPPAGARDSDFCSAFAVTKDDLPNQEGSN